jgi:hypothetical protein
MQDPIFWLTISGAGLIGLVILAWAALSGWRGWLELERMKLDGRREQQPAPPPAAARIELADLKERVRKLEAIAAGVDL